jgi:hypothetical protein
VADSAASAAAFVGWSKANAALLPIARQPHMLGLCTKSDPPRSGQANKANWSKTALFFPSHSHSQPAFARRPKPNCPTQQQPPSIFHPSNGRPTFFCCPSVHASIHHRSYTHNAVAAPHFCFPISPPFSSLCPSHYRPEQQKQRGLPGKSGAAKPGFLITYQYNNISQCSTDGDRRLGTSGHWPKNGKN